MSADEAPNTPDDQPDCDEDATLVASLVASHRVVVVRPWMVAELGIAAIWFAQLLWRIETYGKDVVVRSDGEWEAETGLSRSQVLRARQVVAKRGWITVTIRKSAGTPKPHICLNVTRLAADLRAVHCTKSKSPGSRDIEESSLQLATLEPCDSDESLVDCAQSPDGEPVTSQLFDEPESQPPSVLASFDQFWHAYPKRDGKRLYKDDALVVWQKMTRSDRAAALRGAVNYAQACNQGLNRAKDAVRWLRAHRWNDWQEPAVPDRPRANGKPVVRAGDGTSAAAVANMSPAFAQFLDPDPAPALGNGART